MRRLKQIEWSILKAATEQDKENDKDAVNEASKELVDVLNDTSFGQLYKTLAESKLMSVKMKENLSVPLAFVALLHLCNEKTLDLKALPDFSDFHIAEG